MCYLCHFFGWYIGRGSHFLNKKNYISWTKIILILSYFSLRGCRLSNKSKYSFDILTWTFYFVGKTGVSLPTINYYKSIYGNYKVNCWTLYCDNTSSLFWASKTLLIKQFTFHNRDILAEVYFILIVNFNKAYFFLLDLKHFFTLFDSVKG